MSKPQEPASLDYEIPRKLEENESTGQISSESKIIFASENRNRRKILLKRTLMQSLKPSTLQDGPSDSSLTSDKASKRHNTYVFTLISTDLNVFVVQGKLLNCLSSPLLRRWCIFEWFYSAIDYPWFAKSEFVEYLDHVGLGHIPRLTRVEWGVIRR